MAAPAFVPAATPSRPPVSIFCGNFDCSKIKMNPLDLTPILDPATDGQKLAFILENVLTPQECQDLINLSEETGYSVATLNGRNGQGHYCPDKRDGQRLLVDDRQFADQLFQRIGPYLPQFFKQKKLIEINERLRFLKYSKKGEKFAPHFDFPYARPDGSAKTMITLQIYLNEGFKGGNTTFLNRNKPTWLTVPVVPKTGSVLVFEHRIYHEGSKMEDGQKYTIRLDVLYASNKNFQ